MTYRLLASAALLAALSGCQSPARACQSMGYNPGTQLFLSCIDSRVQADIATSMVLLNAAAQFNAASQPIFLNRGSFTSCSRQGAFVNCITP